jgi:hypothetical protein
MGIGGSPTNATANSAKQDTGSQAASDSTAAEQSSDTGDEAQEKSNRWQVFEVMSNSENALELDYSNPYEAYVYAGMCTLVVLGALGAFLNMRYMKNKKNSKYKLIDQQQDMQFA